MIAAERRRNLALLPWAVAVGMFLYAARRVAPLGLYDEMSYQITYWLVVGAVTIGLASAGWFLLGATRTKRSSLAVARALRWPRAASRAEVVLLTTLTVAVLGSWPRVSLMTQTGGGGAAPFSKVETDVIVFIFRPLLSQMSREASPWQIFGMIAVFWLATGFIAGVSAALLLRATRLSPVGSVLAIAATTEIVLLALRIFSPVIMPF